jgi:alpha-tubulin suppressor-like RCC1 family protein
VALSDGYAFTAGDNAFGQLGVGDSLTRSSLTKVESLTNVSLVACSVPEPWGNDDRNIFFVRNGNQVWATGNNGGWPGVVVPGKVPVKITADSCWQGRGDIVQILSRTSQAIVVLTSDGTLCSWGPGYALFSATHFTEPL